MQAPLFAMNWNSDSKMKNRQQQKRNAGILPLRQAQGQNDKLLLTS